jgi:prevent-host-death family protein
MSFIVNIHEAKTNLSKLLRRVSSGEDIIIAKSGKPIARLVPITENVVLRKLGTAKGKVWIAEDFNAPLPEDILNEFYK